MRLTFGHQTTTNINDALCILSSVQVNGIIVGLSKFLCLTSKEALECQHHQNGCEIQMLLLRTHLEFGGVPNDHCERTILKIGWE